MAKPKSNVELTPELINAVLAGMSVDQLQQAAKTRQLASLQPLVDEWEKIDAEQDERISKIVEIDAEWKPATMGDKIHAWLTEGKEPKTKDQIQKQFPGKNIGLAVSHLVKKGRATLTDGKYSVK